MNMDRRSAKGIYGSKSDYTEELIARSREWMNRSNREGDEMEERFPWRKPSEDTTEDWSKMWRNADDELDRSLPWHRSPESDYFDSYRSPDRERDDTAWNRASEKKADAWNKLSDRSSERDVWRKSVDHFLDDRSIRAEVRREWSPSDRDRSPRPRNRIRCRSRSRSRERRDKYRDRRSSRDRTKRSPISDEEGGSSRRHDRSRSDRQSKRHESSKRRRRSDSEDNSSDKYWSNEDDNCSSFDKSEADYEHKFDSSNIRPEVKFAYKKQVPQKTIIIRGLAQHITEQDIRADIITCGLNCKDIRLVRRKDTGASRGFAFVEFFDIVDATKWIEARQGELMLKDQFRALLQYSVSKDGERPTWLTDWHCKCQAHNFRRRDSCYRCNLPREEGEVMNTEVSSHPTNTVLLRGLNITTTEEGVLQAITTSSSFAIRSVRIGRDVAPGGLTPPSGVCYLEMNSVVDAVYFHNSLQSMNLVIDGRRPTISYAKLTPVLGGMPGRSGVSGQMANAAVAAAQWTHQKPDTALGQQYTLQDVPKLAEYSAALYATNDEEKVSYRTYYEEYYKAQINEGNKILLPTNNTHSSAVVASQEKSSEVKSLTEAPDGSGSIKYPKPDVSTYQYDKTSGYYYDPYTTLYYDPNSTYYYNNKLSKFLYWDAALNTYLPAPDNTDNLESKDDDKKSKEKDGEKDKVKVAKRIAKDMEKWAKTLNQKKEIAKQNIVAQQTQIAQIRAAAAADIGYAVLERKDSIPLTAVSSVSFDVPTKNESLVAAYGQGSDSENDEEDEEKSFTDWSKLACLLCKRQFPSKEGLVKHQQLSDLHKQNLAAWYKSKGIDYDGMTHKQAQQRYRDRAKERRLKYGEPDTPQPNRLKETYIKSREANVAYEEPTKAGIGSENLGNKLLQKMGWQEGMGLGKSNQGRTNIIQTERRVASAGLGSKSVGVTPGPGETYNECVKKMMQVRYNEIEERNYE